MIGFAGVWTDTKPFSAFLCNKLADKMANPRNVRWKLAMPPHGVLCLPSYGWKDGEKLADKVAESPMQAQGGRPHRRRDRVRPCGAHPHAPVCVPPRAVRSPTAVTA